MSILSSNIIELIHRDFKRNTLRVSSSTLCLPLLLYILLGEYVSFKEGEQTNCI